MKLESPAGDITFRLVMSPTEWKEVHALAKFAQTGLTYDCQAPYVIQVFTYFLSQPEDLQSSKHVQAAFSAIDRMAAKIPPDGRSSGDVGLGLPETEMRQLLILLNLAAGAEKQADVLFNAAHEEFPYPFPDVKVAAAHYAQAFDNLLTALHEGRSLDIHLREGGSAAPELDIKNLPGEIRMYLGEKIRLLASRNPEAYASDTRKIETQTDDLVKQINSESLLRYKVETGGIHSQSSSTHESKSPFEYTELKARVEKEGGTISAELNAEQLRAQLSAEQWSQITNIDPELIKAEEKRQQTPFLPALTRFNQENSLANTLLDDEKIRSYLRPPGHR